MTEVLWDPVRISTVELCFLPSLDGPTKHGLLRATRASHPISLYLASLSPRDV